MSLGPASSQWFASSLLALLVAPYIHFNPTPPPIPGPGILPVSLGTGPIDMFSTRFINLFTDGANGTVAGTSVDKDGLKQALLAVQKHWDPANAQFIQEPQQDTTKVRCSGICPQAKSNSSIRVI